jgi:hypothetical protein
MCGYRLTKELRHSRPLASDMPTEAFTGCCLERLVRRKNVHKLQNLRPARSRLSTGSDGRPRHCVQTFGQGEQDEQDDGRIPSGYPVNPVHPVKKCSPLRRTNQLRHSRPLASDMPTEALNGCCLERLVRRSKAHKSRSNLRPTLSRRRSDGRPRHYAQKLRQDEQDEQDNISKPASRQAILSILYILSK